MSTISLTASMRSNLLSLQNISGQVDATQNKLSTGKKVNSAIDNPSSYYTALSLNNRADDLNALLDSMGQAVSTIKAATSALESATEFLEQAKAVANQALEGEQKVQDNPADFEGYTEVSSVDELKNALADANIDKIVITKSLTFATDESLTIDAGKTVSGKSADITLSFNGTKDFSPSITLKGVLKDISISHTSTASSSFALMGGTLEGTVNVSAEGESVQAIRNCKINGTANIRVSGNGSIGVFFGSTINGNVNIYASDFGIMSPNQPVPVLINSSAVVKIYSENNTAISGPFKIVTGAEIWIAGKDDETMTQYKINGDIASFITDANLAGNETGKTSSKEEFKKYVNDCVSGKLKDGKYDSSQYVSILNQYNALIKDASYKGINLLQSDKLSVKFNEDNTSMLAVQGKDMSAKALGLATTEWQSQEDINRSIAELTSAINSIRSYSSELGNNYNIITTRQDFTENLINVLTEGADKLTLADMNEESANMLALQTRQQLAINSLSLASQASQSILKLF